MMITPDNTHTSHVTCHLAHVTWQLRDPYSKPGQAENTECSQQGLVWGNRDSHLGIHKQTNAWYNGLALGYGTLKLYHSWYYLLILLVLS